MRKFKNCSFVVQSAVQKLKRYREEATSPVAARAYQWRGFFVAGGQAIKSAYAEQVKNAQTL